MFCSIYIFRLSWETLHWQNPEPAVTKYDEVEIEREVCVRCAGPRCTCPCAPIRCTRTLHAHVDLRVLSVLFLRAETSCKTRWRRRTMRTRKRSSTRSTNRSGSTIPTQGRILMPSSRLRQLFALQRTPADLDAEKDRLFVAQRSACVPACLSMPCPRRPMVCVWQYGRCSRWRPSHHRRSQ